MSGDQAGLCAKRADLRFSAAFPLELETRLDAATYTKFIESINAPLREAYSVSGAVVDNLIGVLTWWTSLLWRTSRFEQVRSAGPGNGHVTAAVLARLRARHCSVTAAFVGSVSIESLTGDELLVATASVDSSNCAGPRTSSRKQTTRRSTALASTSFRLDPWRCSM